MAGVRRISPENEAEILRQYEGGVRSGEIALAFGINRKTVNIVVKRNGGVIKDQRSASGRPMMHANECLDRVRELKESGASYADIAKDIGHCVSVVGRLLDVLGMRKPKPNLRGAGHGSWKGGVVKNGYGYVFESAPSDWPWPSMKHNGTSYILQHRLVMARTLNRALSSRETVHHINGDKTDNRPENLQIRQGKHGNGQVMVCADCGSHNLVHQKIAG